MVILALIQLLQKSAHLSHLTTCCDQLPLDDACLSLKTKSKHLKEDTALAARVLALPCLLLIVCKACLHAHCGDHKAGCALRHHAWEFTNLNLPQLAGAQLRLG